MRKTRRQMALQRGELIIQAPFQILNPKEYSLDWILCYNAQYGDSQSLAMLHKKYLPVFKKMQFQLIKLARENRLPSDIADDYLGETYDSFLNAVYTMRFDEEKIQGYKHCWGLYKCLQQYLHSRNRDIMKKFLKQNAYEIRLDYDNKADKEDHIVRGIASVKSTEQECVENEMNGLFWDAVNRTLKKLNPIQVNIFRGLQDGKNKSKIIEGLNITKKEFEEHLHKIQETFQQYLSYKMKIGDIGKIEMLLSA